MIKKVNTFIRTARHDWTCCKCGRSIKAGEEYRDVETKLYFAGLDGCEGVNISHYRSCITCQKKIYDIIEPEPVSVGHVKYNLIGVGYNDNKLRLIIENWNDAKKQWADEVYNWQGERLTVENVRFVNVYK